MHGSGLRPDAGERLGRGWFTPPAERSTLLQCQVALGGYAQLVDQGVLVQQGSHRMFSKSYVFSSTSAAAAIVSGRPASGPKSWMVEGTNQNYGDWELAQLQAVEENT